jgi:exodeoxyribonuclease V alpha subunit
MEKYIKGIYRKCIYDSKKGYIIGLFKVKDTNDPSMEDYKNKTITFTGTFPALNIDDTYLFFGEPVKHARYGFQYNVNNFERVKPEDIDGVIEFLSSDLFPGIGDKLASKIVETLGLNALELIMEDPTVLSMIPRLSNKKAATIYNNLLKYEQSHTVIVYLTELGFAIKDAMSIYNTYKGNTESVIKENIYSLISDVPEINFSKVDSVALKNGIDHLDRNRVKAIIISVMEKLCFNNGDSYLDVETIFKYVQAFLKVPLMINNFDEYLFELEKENKIIKYNDVYYLFDLFKAEDNVAKEILRKASIDEIKNTKIIPYLEHLEEVFEIKYNDKQKEAIIKALTNNILIITGGPGTGKTTIINAIVKLYQELNDMTFDRAKQDIALLAPTGRASKRMAESTGYPASTIHRFLKCNKDNNEFAVNEENKDQSKLIIVDEVSMIDILLLDSLFKGINEDARIIFVGDKNQLPSVGPGQVLKDIIDSDIVNVVKLDLLYRQDENSYINKLAIEIKDNELNEHFLDPKSDYQFLKCTKLSLRDNLKKICIQLVEKGYGYRRLQILAPMYHGENGIDNLNNELQNIFNPPSRVKKEIVYGDVIYRQNDKVLQLVNQPDDNIYNGDIGIIKDIITKDNKTEILIDFEGNEVLYKQADFNKFKHGFIISIHKSQGSESEMVILPICTSYNRMLYRKLLYTAVTRAKKKLIVIGEPMAFIACVENNNEYIRDTSLKERILELLNKK